MKIIDTAKALPPSGHFVLAWLEGSKIPMRALWADKFSLGVSAEQSPEWGEYSEEKDEYFCPAGWYEMNQHEESHWRVDGNVVAWCELPRLDHQCLAQIEEPAGAAPAAVAGPASAGWRLVPTVPTRGWIAAVADDGYFDVDCEQLIANILSHAPAAPALEAPAAPTIAVQIQALHRARRALHAIGKTYDDSELRTRALEADEEIGRLLAAAPQAPAVPADVLCYIRALPLEADDAMAAAACRIVDLEQGDPEDHRYDDGTKCAKDIYRAMVEAALASAPAAEGLHAMAQSHMAAPAAPAEAQRLAEFLQRMRTRLGSCRDACGDAASMQAWDDYERAWTLLQGMAAPAAPSASTLPDAAYCALQFVEHALAAIADRKEQLADAIHPVDTIGKASKRAKSALTRLQAVAHHFDAATPAAPAVDAQAERDAAFEAVRNRLCGLQRYSFVLDDDGVVRRAQDRTGSWIEFDDAHALFDPEAVDAAIAAQAAAKGAAS